MESFEQKIKERNNLLKSQVESLTGRNELTEVIDTLLKAGVSEEDLVEKAKYIRREPDGKGGYKYIYDEKSTDKKRENSLKKEYEKKLGLRGYMTSGDFVNAVKNGSIKQEDIAVVFNSLYEDQRRVALKMGGWTNKDEIKTDKVDKKEKKFPELKEGLTFSIGEQSGGGEVTAKITKVENGKYTIETFTKDEHKSSHTFGVKEIKELIEEGGFKIKKSSESDLEKAKADKKQQKKIKKVMDEWKAGSLLDSHGNKITDRKQVLAVALSEAGLSKKK